MYYNGALHESGKQKKKQMERWLSWSKAHDWKSCNV